MDFLLPLLLFAVAWYLFIRPQQQRVKAQRALHESLSVGVEVITAGGIIGTVTAVEDEEVRLSVSPSAELRVVRQAIVRRIGGTEAPPEPFEPGEDDAG